ncbi:MAG: glycosyltransferase family 4 protein, partial [Candidatus Methylomirabilales bacterium]
MASGMTAREQTSRRKGPLRLCLCVSLFRPAIGGAERQAEQLARVLAARGHRVTVVTQRLPGTAPEEELDGVRVVRAIRTCNRGPLFGLTYVLSLAYYLLRYQGSFDLIQANYLYLDAFTALATRPLHRKPVILRPAGGGPGGDLTRLPTLRFWPLWPRLDRPIHALLLRTMRRADAVVALSSQLADEVRAAGFPPTRIVRIPNGVDHRQFVPVDGATRRARQAALGAAGPVLTFVGRLHAQKDVATLLDAAGRLRAEWPGIHVLLVGAGPEEDALRCLARGLELKAQVRFTGGVADVIPYLDATDVFVHPSRAEGMPGALLEAMACGLPCVATRIGGTADVITDGEDGLLVKPGDVAGMTAAIARLLADPEL